MITIYGIPNCDIIKKAKDWLDKHKIEYQFHDYKKSGINKEKLTTWINKTGLETLLNKKSTTWKGLSEKEQQQANNQDGAIKIMMENNSIIKRPVIEKAGVILVGFNETEFIKHLK